MMASTAGEYVRTWRLTNIYGEPRRVDEHEKLMAQCLKDAERNGISRDDLSQAAAGDLKKYILDAIESATDAQAPRVR